MIENEEKEREREIENMQLMSGNRFELMPSQDLEQVSVADTEANPTSPYGSWDQLPAGGLRKLGPCWF